MIRRKATRIELKQEDIQEFDELYERQKLADFRVKQAERVRPLGENFSGSSRVLETSAHERNN
eukprot:CAMPEP_0184018064 /NCGR_PEP_ID=MMETSP0954-20121128/7915_1 /TAXON_ID=627963 /ORGANISM="Aplanochytrium sp, Strain PBS07" /LENGTH=62 /DNA_ID=CAMNT_0026299431 /DNA_START=154 /DNA_END=342 /DNA_ORIENTATION=+